MAGSSAFMAMMAAAALAGVVGMAIVFSGGAGPQAADPPGAGAGIGAAVSEPQEQPQPQERPQELEPQELEPQQQQQRTDAPPRPPVRTEDVRALPAPGAAVPPDARTFYTKADLMEFVEGGGASPVATLVSKYPVGGTVVSIMTGGMDETLELAARAAMTAEGSSFREGVMAEAAPAGASPQADGGPAAAGMFQADEGMAAPSSAPASSSAPAAPPSPDHSTTNVQVEGVDEPDFVKNDERHIYILDGGELTIIDALPADTVRVLSGDSAGSVRDSYRPEDASIAFRGPIGSAGDYRYDNMFLDGDSLVVIYESMQWASVPLDPADPTRTVAVQLPSTYVMWVDIGNRSAPVPAGEYAVDGEYRTARMMGGTVYLATQTDLGERGPPSLPGLRYSTLEGRAPGVPCYDPVPGAGPRAAPACEAAPLVPPAHYVAPVEGTPSLTTVSALTPGGSAPAAQTYLLGGDDIAYVSQSAAYLALPRMAPSPGEILGGLRDTGLLPAMVEPIDAKWRQEALSAAASAGEPEADRLEAVLAAVQRGYEDLEPKRLGAALQALDETAWSWHYAVVPADPRTIVHRIEIGAAPGGAPTLSHAGAGEVGGRPLDQFSMDEHGGMFRIATNVENGRDPPHTAVHVLDAGSMSVAASLEGIAPGETMRSARFAGETLFLVTFLQVDPFFVIDMSGPVPAILGELKIPGFSSYLQPYGPGMVVGVGTYVSENLDEPSRDWAVKVSLYDVTDYRRPILADEIIIGDAATWSPAQISHRALLADAERGIIALPVVFEQGQPPLQRQQPPQQPPPQQPQWPDGAGRQGGWTGFYAFGTDAAAASLGEAHAIRHGAAVDGAPSEGRSLYIADWLYTIYDGMLVISDLRDPGQRVKSIDLG